MTLRIEAPDVFTPVLSRLHTDAAAYFAVGSLRLVPSQWQERPSAYLLRLGVWRDGDDLPMSHLFLKVFKPRAVEGGPEAMRRRVASDYETNHHVYTLMSRENDLGAVPTVACYPELLAIVTEEVEGPTLLEYLQAKGAWFPSESQLERLSETMTSVGRWIRMFQPTGSGGGYPTTDHLRRYIDVRLQRLARHSGSRFTEGDRKRVLGHVDLLGSHVAPQELNEVAVHADLALGNIIVSGRRIVVLDFAMAKLGNSLHDLTRLFVQMDLLGIKPQQRMSVIRRLQRALLEGFDPALKPRRPLFRLLLLLHRVNHLTTLSVNRAPLAEALYNRVVHRQHRRWIASEISRAGDAAEWP